MHCFVASLERSEKICHPIHRESVYMQESKSQMWPSSVPHQFIFIARSYVVLRKSSENSVDYGTPLASSRAPFCPNEWRTSRATWDSRRCWFRPIKSRFSQGNLAFWALDHFWEDRRSQSSGQFSSNYPRMANGRSG